MERAERVDRFAGLAHDEEERVAGERRVAITELGGVIDLHRHAGESLDEVLGYEAGVPSGAAAEKYKAVDLAEIDGAEVQAAEFGGATILREATAHGVLERGGLLKNLLFHEMCVAVHLGGIDGPRHFIDDRGDVLLIEG